MAEIQNNLMCLPFGQWNFEFICDLDIGIWDLSAAFARNC